MKSMRIVYAIPGFNNFTFASNSDIRNDHRKFLFALKISLRRKNKMTIIDFMKSLGYTPITCNHCGCDLAPDKIEYVINDSNDIAITNISYKNDRYRFCKKKGCPGGKLNPNSAEFVQKTYSFNTKEEALSYIHSRNKTPFYGVNHSSEEEYKKSQRRDRSWYEAHNKSYDDALKLANYHRSVEYKIEQLGIADGIDEYKKICKLKSLFSKSELDKRYDKNTVNDIRKKFILSSSHNMIPDDIFTSIDSLCKFVYDRLPITHKYNIDLFYIKNKIAKKGFVEVACDCNNITIDEFCDKFYNYCMQLPNGHCENIDFVFIKSLSYGNLYKTKECKLLRSRFELNFYVEMCVHGLNNRPYDTDKLYPNQSKTYYRYDFYFPEIDFYVELAGMHTNEEYRNKLKEKKLLFNPYVVYTDGDICKCIDKILSLYKLKESTE